MNKFLSLLALVSVFAWINAQSFDQVGDGGQDITTANAETPASMVPMVAPEELPLPTTELAAVSPAPIELEPPVVVPETKPIEQIADEMEGKNLAEAEDIVTAPAVEQPIALDVVPEIKPVVATVSVAEPSMAEPSMAEPKVETAKPAEAAVPDMVQNPQPEPGTIADLT